MQSFRGILVMALLAFVASALAATQASAQAGIPEIPIGPAPRSVSPSIVSAEAVAPGHLAPWLGVISMPLAQAGWQFHILVIPSVPRSSPAVLRESRGWEPAPTRIASGRLGKR
jgi:hypothetical protein